MVHHHTTLIIYTDGGARGNPGISGAGAYITDEAGDVVQEIAKPLGIRTNNWAEYEAVIEGLAAAAKILGKKAPLSHVELRTDSELVVKQLKGEYRVKHPELKKQFAKVAALRAEHFPHLSIKHVRREFNKEADRLSNVAMDEETARH